MDTDASAPLYFDDNVRHCKKCGLILEEGRAYELGGNRWHVDCFRCSICDEQLDSDTNLLVLGNGNLVCNNCSYHCCVCKRKIEDLAILTGDQAFCSSCFKCRNCKKRIEDLQYARTSQGIFCMSCHEALLARKKKTASKKPRVPMRTTSESSLNNGSGPNTVSPSLGRQYPLHHGSSGSLQSLNGDSYFTSPSLPSSVKDKSLPSLPTGMNSPIVSTGSLPNTRAIEKDQTHEQRISGNSSNGQISKSEIRSSQQSNLSDLEVLVREGTQTNELDPRMAVTLSSPSTTTPPIAVLGSTNNSQSSLSLSTLPHADKRVSQIFIPSGGSDEDESSGNVINIYDQGRRRSRRSNVEEHKIAEQVWTDSHSPKSTKTQDKAAADVVDARTQEPNLSSISSIGSSDLVIEQPLLLNRSQAPSSSENVLSDKSNESINGDALFSQEANEVGLLAPERSTARGRSIGMERSAISTKQAREASTASARSTRQETSSIRMERQSSDALRISDNNDGMTSESFLSVNGNHVPERSGLRPSSPLPLKFDENQDTPSTPNSRSQSSLAAIRRTPKTPQSPRQARVSRNIGSPLSAEEVLSDSGSELHSGPELGSRGLLGGQHNISHLLAAKRKNSSTSLSSIGHKRSGSDKASSPKSHIQSASSPLSNPKSLFNFRTQHSPSQQVQSQAEVGSQTTAELTAARAKIAELEASHGNARDLDEGILERRKTIANLNAAKQVAEKELEVINSKKSPKIADELVGRLQEVKSQLQAEIADLILQRDSLSQDVTDAKKKRDILAEESSVLNIRNSQLLDMNNTLTKQLIEKFGPYVSEPTLVGGSTHLSASSALGSTVSQTNSSNSLSASDSQNYNLPNHAANNINNGGINEEQMVTILDVSAPADNRSRDKRTFWKRPRAAVAKLNKVFTTEQPQHDHQLSSSPSTNFSEVELGNSSISNLSQGGNPAINIMYPGSKKAQPLMSSAGGPISSKAAGTLSGLTLEERLQVEGRKIPLIVTQCIEEVERRGMTYEGVYRKSGGKSQIVSIEEAFAHAAEEGTTVPSTALEGDIAGVTSALKQFLRNLPSALISHSSYDLFIEAVGMPDSAQRHEGLQKMLTVMPNANRDCLKCVILHLAKVVKFSERNLMSTKNLAVVFAPTLARHEMNEREISDMQARNEGTQMLIEHCDEIFVV